MQGKTKECLTHYVGRVGSPALAIDAYLKQHPQANKITVERWFKKDLLPVGLPLIELQCFLEDNGYHITTDVALHPAIIAVRRALARKTITIDGANAAMGYAAPDQIYRALLGKRAPVPTYLEKFVLYAQTLHSSETSNTAHAETTHGTSLLSVGEMKKVVVAQILALSPLVEVALSDAFSPEDRDEVRAATGGDGIFKLKNALARLCGERARETL